MNFEIVIRHVNRLTTLQNAKVLNKKICVKRIGTVIVCLDSFLQGRMQPLRCQHRCILRALRELHQSYQPKYGDGRGYNKRPNPAVFLPKVVQAIRNAKEIADGEDMYPKTLGSDVYKLVEKLIKKDL